MVYPHDGIFSNKEEQATDVYCMNEPSQYCAKWKTPKSKYCILIPSIGDNRKGQAKETESVLSVD